MGKKASLQANSLDLCFQYELRIRFIYTDL